MLPSSAELEYFLELSNSLNFSRASERLGISQPSLSLAIKRLEKSVGASLFIRLQHGVVLTQAGKQLVLHVRNLLEDWGKAKSQALASHREVQGYFTIGSHSTMANHIISGFLPDLLENNPKLEIQLTHDLSRNIMEKVINLSIDIGIVANPIKHPDLVLTKLCDDEVSFWKGPGTRKIQDIHANQAIILCDPDLMQTQSLLKAAKRKNINYSRILKINSLEVVANLTANGCGIGILPARVAKSMYPDKLKPIANAPIYNDEIVMIYRNETRNIYAMQVIIKTIKQFFHH